ncbi:MAG TPA: DUF3108 domain-containing protein [Pyrinomonadaceae bacterium]|nr:DUF3108 domain-containing protein [Pyrinomonadaceae bacterium]
MTRIVSYKLKYSLALIAGFLAFAGVSASAQTTFRIGEKITYGISFDTFSDIAYAETYVVSRGKFGDKDAVELRGKFKTRDFWSAAFFLVDESRVVFVSPEGGIPLYISRSLNSGIPKEVTENFLTSPTSSFDLLSLIYKIRASGGAGAATISENGSVHAVTFAPVGTERVKTDSGEFDTQIISVQSDFFTPLGVRDLRVNLSTDEAKIPALIRFKTSKKGEFRMAAASVKIIVPEPEITPTPVPIQTPMPVPTPRQTPTPTPYVDNRPLRDDLAFELGETLEYQVSAGGQFVGAFRLQAKERKQFRGTDSLLLLATATDARPGSPLFASGDTVSAYVNPEALTPIQVDIRLRGQLSSLNNSLSFDTANSRVTFGGANSVDVPVGTQSLLSLLYAIRSYNLKPSRDISNPVNDTRVAVFWDKVPVVFTLRPSNPELISVGDEKVSAQMISVSTGNVNPQLDQLQIRIWLSNDERRLPLRISAGGYQAELIPSKK